MELDQYNLGVSVVRPNLRAPARVFGRALFVILAAWVVVTFAIVPVGVRGRGMLPTVLPGDVLIVAKYERWGAAWNVQDVIFPRRGDLVILKPPTGAGDARVGAREVLAKFGSPGEWLSARVPGLTFRPYLVRRVAALSGDTVNVKGGQLLVNGEVVYGQGAQSVKLDPRLPDSAATATIPVGTIYVTRDAPAADEYPDSRTFGPLPLAEVAGRVIFRLWPAERVGSIQRGAP